MTEGFFSHQWKGEDIGRLKDHVRKHSFAQHPWRGQRVACWLPWNFTWGPNILAESMRRKARRTYDLANLSKASQGRSEICTDKKSIDLPSRPSTPLAYISAPPFWAIKRNGKYIGVKSVQISAKPVLTGMKTAFSWSFSFGMTFLMKSWTIQKNR
jgi:hypothetical protein